MVSLSLLLALISHMFVAFNYPASCTPCRFILNNWWNRNYL